MSKKMTPCEMLGYKVGDKFEVIEDSAYFKEGEIVYLRAADNSNCPFFINEKVVRDGYSKGCAMYISSVKKISKLKPAKQALADAINQNGGWVDGAKWFAISSADMTGGFWSAKEHGLSRENGIWCGHGYMYGCCFSVDRLPVNHHQTILSRDEYFTAYPEQVKVEVNNETEQKVGDEMTSESETTINVGDWHKNGELPPVGEVCEAYIDYPPQWIETEIVAHKDGFAIGWCKSVMKGCHGDKTHEFRQIRTERDKAIEEIAKAIIAKSPVRISPEDAVHLAGEMYDYGYRKEVK